MGIFDLFIVNLDGSNLRQITHGGCRNGRWAGCPTAASSTLCQAGSTSASFTVSTFASGESQVFSNENIQSLAGWPVCGHRQSYLRRALGGGYQPPGADRWALANDGLWVLNPLWSPDGEWLLATVSATDSGSTTGALINLRTCQVISLPHIQGNLLGWKP